MKKLINNVVSLFLFMVFVLLVLGVGSAADADQKKNMELVGTNDLQARSTYQPTIHRYPGDRYILFAGHHALGTNPVTGQPLPSFNPLTNKNELNGTSLVDVTDPKHPKLLVHIPVSDGASGGAQMVRVCDGSVLPIGNTKVYMLRTYANSAHEIWDVTDPSKPVGVRTVAAGNPVIGADTGKPGALAGTHKSWWECDTGIAYIVGRRGNDTTNGWRAGNHIFIFDLSNPANPVSSGIGHCMVRNQAPHFQLGSPPRLAFMARFRPVLPAASSISPVLLLTACTLRMAPARTALCRSLTGPSSYPRPSAQV